MEISIFIFVFFSSTFQGNQMIQLFFLSVCTSSISFHQFFFFLLFFLFSSTCYYTFLFTCCLYWSQEKKVKVTLKCLYSKKHVHFLFIITIFIFIFVTNLSFAHIFYEISFFSIDLALRNSNNNKMW